MAAFKMAYPHLTDSVALTVFEIPIHVEAIWYTLYLIVIYRVKNSIDIIIRFLLE